MALESGTYINSLNSSNPAATDGLSQADDHMRLIKGTIKSTFPNITGAVDATQAELNVLDGITSSTDELNVLDGITATTTELNVLDGITATTTELNKLSGVTTSSAEFNFVDGVTSGIQAQLDGKQASNDILSDLAGLTQAAAKIPYFDTDDTASTLGFVDEDDMTSNSDTSVPSQQSVKAYVDANAGDSVTFSSTGGQADVGGLQIRFGSFQSTTDGDEDVTFDTDFDTACLVVLCNYAGTIVTKSTTGFTFNRLDEHINKSDPIGYIAIGH